LHATIHVDTYNDNAMPGQIAEYDRRRDAVLPYEEQRYVTEYGHADFYGWSEDKARQVSKPERADFGAFVRGKHFKLD
jgi:nitroreductase/FMN reductase [NAD(P)H]